MFRRRWIFGLLLVLCVLSLSACGKSKSQSRPSPVRKSAQPKKPSKPVLPPQFGAIESEALKLYTGFTNWSTAQIQLNTLRTDWRQLKGNLIKAKVPEEKLAAVEIHLNGIGTGIKTQDRFKVAEQSNELVGALWGLTEKYQVKIPPELILLQTDLREIHLHAAVGNWTILEGLSKKAQQDWKMLKPKAKTVGGDAIGKNIESYFKELDAAIKVKDAKKTQEILGLFEPDLVTMRTSFEGQPPPKQQNKKKQGS